jgi:hypothetical protein
MCLYYLLILRYNIREETTAKRVEPFIHIFAFSFPLVFASILVSLDGYNPANAMIGWCFINAYPADCVRRDEIKSTRDKDYQPWMTITTAPFLLYFLVVLISSILVYFQVRKLELRNNSRWSYNSNSQSNAREKSIQASLYICTFACIYVFYFATNVAFFLKEPIEENRTLYLTLVALTKIFIPFRGFWNFFICVQPRYSALKRRNNTMTVR